MKISFVSKEIEYETYEIASFYVDFVISKNPKICIFSHRYGKEINLNIDVKRNIIKAKYIVDDKAKYIIALNDILNTEQLEAWFEKNKDSIIAFKKKESIDVLSSEEKEKLREIIKTLIDSIKLKEENCIIQEMLKDLTENIDVGIIVSE